MDRKLGSMETEIQSVVKHLDESMESQQDIVNSLQTMKTSSQQQFTRFSEHLVNTGENVHHLTTAITDIREEMNKLSTFLQGLATRQYEQEKIMASTLPTSVQEFLHGNFPIGRSIHTPSASSGVPFGSFSPNSGVSPNRTPQHSQTSAAISVSDTAVTSIASNVVCSPSTTNKRQHGTISSPPRDTDMSIDSGSECTDIDDVFNDDSAMFDTVLLHDALWTNPETRFASSAPATQPHTEAVDVHAHMPSWS